MVAVRYARANAVQSADGFHLYFSPGLFYLVHHQVCEGDFGWLVLGRVRADGVGAFPIGSFGGRVYVLAVLDNSRCRLHERGFVAGDLGGLCVFVAVGSEFVCTLGPTGAFLGILAAW